MRFKVRLKSPFKYLTIDFALRRRRFKYYRGLVSPAPLVNMQRAQDEI